MCGSGVSKWCFSVKANYTRNFSGNQLSNCAHIFREFPKRVVSKMMGLADVPPDQKPERGYIRMFTRNENRNEGTFACSPGTKSGTRAHSPKPPLYETTLLSPSEAFTQKNSFRILCVISSGLIVLGPKHTWNRFSSCNAIRRVALEESVAFHCAIPLTDKYPLEQELWGNNYLAHAHRFS